ncbi:MAG: radical SAM protein [Firmicutes bacterium]|nr:radical SAM protein [Bacillota bacterium]
MYKKSISLVVDMYGCPNRCKHCWLGNMPNRKMEENADQYLVDYFKPYFDSVTYYSWLREPDYCPEYAKRWITDNKISINKKPMRFELASFWRIVRDSNYIIFLKEVNVKVVQLTFFGLEKLTDKYIGRSGAFQELLKATKILIENKISPRWQAFINEETRNEIVDLLELSKELKIHEKCLEFGGGFKFFVHSGSCDGENAKLYNIRINKENIPIKLIPYYLDYDEVLTEQECCDILKSDSSHFVYHNDGDIVLNISNTYDIYFNFTQMSEEWKIGNLKTEDQVEIIRRIIKEDIPALNLARNITVEELVQKYGDKNSHKAFHLSDYKSYLLNCCVKDILGKSNQT